MTAAHELIERAFKVTVFEKHKTLVGGKARSIPVPDSATPGKLELPGEHGFRFFPGFYTNIIERMSRIPFRNKVSGVWNKNGVKDNLVACPNVMIARDGQAPIYTPTHPPKTLQDVIKLIREYSTINTGLQEGESKVIARKIWQLLTSCQERWEEQYEGLSWWDYTEASKYSEAYRQLFVTGLTRTLVAAQAETANTRTNGKILLQMLFNFTNPTVPADRILCGPTNEMWLDPWYEYLHQRGVDYQRNCKVTGFECDNQRVTGVFVSKAGGAVQKYTADYYLCAVPVERTAQLVGPLISLDPSLQNIVKLSESVAWMNGIQFYLKNDVSINKGHILLIDSPWALSVISQIQFWKDFDLTRHGDGQSRGIISVDVSNWEKNGVLYGKPAKYCTEKEVIDEVWEQMKRAFNVNGKVVLEDSNRHAYYIDEDIIFDDGILANKAEKAKVEQKQSHYGSNRVNSNEEPLLINAVDSWKLRNEAKTRIPNFFLAADFVRNYTNLASMEGANEAARFAVNHILDIAGSTAPRCKIQNLKEPTWLNVFKRIDKARYKKGEPWKPATNKYAFA